VGKLGSGVVQGRVSDLYKLVEDAEIFLVARGVTGYMGEVGLLSISLLEPCSESDSTEIAVPLPLFNGECWEEVRLGTDFGDRSSGEVGEESLWKGGILAFLGFFCMLFLLKVFFVLPIDFTTGSIMSLPITVCTPIIFWCSIAV